MVKVKRIREKRLAEEKGERFAGGSGELEDVELPRGETGGIRGGIKNVTDPEERKELVAASRERIRQKDIAERGGLGLRAALEEGIKGIPKPEEEVLVPEVPEVPLVETRTPEQIEAGMTVEDVEAFGSVEAFTAAGGGGGIVPVTATDVATLLPLGRAGNWALKVGEKTFFSSKKATQELTTQGWKKVINPAVEAIKRNPWKSLVGAALFPRAVEAVLSATFLRKVDDTQQGLNTLGQITSSIVGDSKTSAGNVYVGLDELLFIEKTILELEQDIQSGKIESSTLKFNGKIIDINADTYDQLATLGEGIRDLRSFILGGQFPELTPSEIQEIMREAEADGLVEAVDLTTARRPVTQRELSE
jgi:hypothetical protein